MTASAPEPEAREACRGCGARFKGLICEYCGLASRRAEDPALEREALDEFHVLLARGEKDVQARLLRDGFLPGSRPNLLEAAVVCLRFLDDSDPLEPGDSALKRLDAIVAKLSALPTSAELEGAIANYRQRIAAYRKAEDAYSRSGMTIVMIVGAVAVACFVWLLWKLIG
jgi:hypothetical protein